jgi:hypothetical protein
VNPKDDLKHENKIKQEGFIKALKNGGLLIYFHVDCLQLARGPVDGQIYDTPALQQEGPSIELDEREK